MKIQSTLRLIALIIQTQLLYSCENFQEKSSGKVDIEYKIATTLPSIKVDNGHSEDYYLLDTGSSVSFFPEDDFKNVTDRTPMTVTFARNRNKIFETIGGVTIKVGEKRITSTTKNVATSIDRDTTVIVPLILGMNFLSNLVLSFDMDGHTIELSDGLKHISSLQGFTKHPIKIIDDQPFVNLKVGGIERKFLIDTGYSGFCAIKELTSCENTFIIKEPVNAMYSGTSIDGLSKQGYCVENLSIADINLKNEIIVYDNSLTTNVIGIEFFRRFEQVVFDFRNSTLYLGKQREYKSTSYLRDALDFVNTVGFLFTTATYPIVYAKQTGLTTNIELMDTLFQIGEISVFKPVEFKPYEDTTFSQSHWVLRALRYGEFDTLTILTRRDGVIKKSLIKRKKTIPLKGMLFKDNIEPTDQMFNPFLEVKMITNYKSK